LSSEKNREEESREGEPAAPWMARRSERPHDFQKPRLVSGDRIEALDTLHRKFARIAAAGLSGLLRSRTQVELLGLAQKSYFDFIRGLPNPTSLCLVYCLPDRLPLVLEVSPSVLFPMIERLLGGKRDDAPVPSRPLTRIEQELAKAVANQILAALEESWKGALSSAAGCAAEEPGDARIRFDVAEVEHNPLLMQIVGPTEPALVLSFQVALGAAGLGLFHICLPAKPFENLLAVLSRSSCTGAQDEHNTAEERERILKRLAGTTLELSAELASVPIALPDLLGLRPGDVIDTQVSRASEIALVADGRRAFSGRPAERDGRRVLKITRCEESS
jgi:flagellar motor switch protein FliM